MSFIPRENCEKSIRELLLEWPLLKEEIRQAFTNRDKTSAVPLMRAGIDLFIEFLHCSNEQPTKVYPEINYEQLLIQPVNMKERLEFIISRPSLHHSYMQLCELMTELEKSYKKALAIKKRK